MNTSSDSYYRSLVESMSCTITHLNRDFSVQRQFNAENTVIECVTGQPFPAADAYLQSVSALHLAKLDRQKSVQFETQHESDAGNTIWYQHTANLIVDGDGILVVSVDITAQKEHEAEARKIQRRYQAIFNNTNDTVAINAFAKEYNDDVLIAINKRGEEVLGYSFDELRQMDSSSVIAPDERLTVLDRRAQRVAGDNDRDLMLPLRVVRKDGSIRHLEGINLIIKDEDDKPIEIIGIMRDVTERVQREQELLEAKIAAEQALQARELFVANMSHELRNPLHLIKGHAELLLNNPHLSREQLNGLQAITYSIDHLTQLVGDVLDLTRIETERDAYRPRTFHLRQLLDRLIGVTTIRAQQKNLSFEMRVFDDVPVLVRMDDVKLKQILINLIDNAIKYTIEGQVRLRVAVEARQHLRFDVIDTGIGISSDAIEQMFQPFVRGEHTGAIPGVGLGLLISKRLVDVLGGTIEITSQSGSGTNVCVILPFEDVEPHALVDEDMHEKALTRFESGMSALIFFNQIEQCVLIEKYLQRLELHVETSSMTDMVQVRLDEARPDIILIDLAFDTGQTLDLVKRIRHAERDLHMLETPIISIISDTHNGIQKRLRDAGCDVVIIKPYRLSELSAAIAALLHLRPDTTPDREPVSVPVITSLQTQDLTGLPHDWLRQMYHLCMMGYYREGLELLASIESDHVEVAASLRQMLSQMWTLPIAELIEPLLADSDRAD